MYFLIVQAGDMLWLCFNYNESQPKYAYKRYAYKKSLPYNSQNIASNKFK